MSQSAGPVGELLDGLVAEILRDLGIQESPVDALAVARGLGLQVRVNRLQSERGRVVESNGLVTIVVRPEPRKERYQWTIARQIGVYLIPRIMDRLPEEMALLDTASSDWLASRFAMHLLVPTDWFDADVRRLDGDLSALKLLYRTVSYEVLAMRLLDVRPATLMTIFDNGRLTRRMSNLPYRAPNPTPIERDCWTDSRRNGRFARRADLLTCVRAWPIHEDGWNREILLTEVNNLE